MSLILVTVVFGAPPLTATIVVPFISVTAMVTYFLSLGRIDRYSASDFLANCVPYDEASTISPFRNALTLPPPPLPLPRPPLDPPPPPQLAT